MSYYAYLHARPDGSVFYVGKGRNGRGMNVCDGYNPYHLNIVKKYGRENVLVGKIDCSSEEIAFALERGLIKCLKRMNVKLVNQSDGGEGNSGWSHTCQTRQAIAKSHTGQKRTEQHCSAISLGLRGRVVPTPVCEKISATKKSKSAEAHHLWAGRLKVSLALRQAIKVGRPFSYIRGKE